MTSMPHLVPVAGSADDAASELANLRAAYASACDELIEVRRQRDEAVAHGQELLSRLADADEKLARAAAAQAPVFAVETEPIRVAPAQAAPDPVSPIPTIIGVPPLEPPVLVAEAVAAAVPPVDAPVDEMDDNAPVDIDQVPAAPQPVRWLPPDEGAVTPSTAHEFAALKELPDAVEEDEPVAAVEPLTSPMNVLPAGEVDPKGSRWRLRVR